MQGSIFGNHNVDRDVPMLLKMFEKRQRAYRVFGYALD
jgi:hypothetical protein